jgi:hypothetical protein
LCTQCICVVKIIFENKQKKAIAEITFYDFYFQNESQRCLRPLAVDNNLKKTTIAPKSGLWGWWIMFVCMVLEFGFCKDNSKRGKLYFIQKFLKSAESTLFHPHSADYES